MEKTVITIVGLGQIGTSIGLALEDYADRLHRVGHTRDIGHANHAKKAGAIDKVALNLPGSVRKADIVVLALPADEVREVLELIAPDLREGVVVLDTSPARAANADWVLDKLPDNRYYVGFTPVLNPRMLQTAEGGIKEADAELFQDGLFAITSPMNASSDALKVAGDLATMMKAVPLFSDVTEVDSYISKVHLLPQLLAACLANVSIGTPGWEEGRKLSGRAFTQLTNLLQNSDPARAVAHSAQMNKEHMVRMLDEAIEELQAMRAELDSDADEALTERLERASVARERWWAERQMVRWISEGEGELDFSQVDTTLGKLFGMGQHRPKRE